jgi:hypothetical protein
MRGRATHGRRCERHFARYVQTIARYVQTLVPALTQLAHMFFPDSGGAMHASPAGIFTLKISNHEKDCFTSRFLYAPHQLELLTNCHLC